MSEPADELAGDEEERAAPPKPALMELPSGLGHSAEAASRLMKKAMTSIILVAGTAECGKTTLLASLYHLFQTGPFADYQFAGSSTLVGFEHRVYFARTVSGGKKPRTERTKVSEYLHLQVRKKGEPIRDLILCDLSGEDFEQIKNTADVCKRHAVIRRADKFVLLVDGEKLASEDARQQAKSDPLSLLRMCLDCEMLGVTSTIDVLFTKWDVIEGHKDKDEIMTFASHVEDQIKSRFGNRVKEIRVTRVAAHPTPATLPIGHGLTDVFSSWIEAGLAGGAQNRVMREPSNLSEFDRYFRRRCPEVFEQD
jgi:hypothetical protein